MLTSDFWWLCWWVRMRFRKFGSATGHPQIWTLPAPTLWSKVCWLVEDFFGVILYCFTVFKRSWEAIFRVTYDFEWRLREVVFLREVVTWGNGDLGKWGHREMVTQGSGDFGKSWLWVLHGTCVGRMPECFLVWGGRSRRRTGAVRTVMAVSICFACSCTWQLHGVLESLVTKRTVTHYKGCINAPLSIIAKPSLCLHARQCPVWAVWSLTVVRRGCFESVLFDQPVASTSYLSLLGFGSLGASLNK